MFSSFQLCGAAYPGPSLPGEDHFLSRMAPAILASSAKSNAENINTENTASLIIVMSWTVSCHAIQLKMINTHVSSPITTRRKMLSLITSCTTLASCSGAHRSRPGPGSRLRSRPGSWRARARSPTSARTGRTRSHRRTGPTRESAASTWPSRQQLCTSLDPVAAFNLLVQRGGGGPVGRGHVQGLDEVGGRLVVHLLELGKVCLELHDASLLYKLQACEVCRCHSPLSFSQVHHHHKPAVKRDAKRPRPVRSDHTAGAFRPNPPAMEGSARTLEEARLQHISYAC